MKCFKPKMDNKNKKVNDQIINELKYSIKHDPKYNCLEDRYNKIKERLGDLNICKNRL